MVISLKFLFLSESFYPHYGGAELATYLYAKRLAEKNHEVVVVTNRFPNEAKISKLNNFTIYRLNLLNEISVKYSILLRFDVLNSSFIKKLVSWSDLVYIPRYWFSAIPIIKRLGKPVLVHLHDYIPICPLSNIYNLEKDQICDTEHCESGCIWMSEKYQGKDTFNAAFSTILNSTIGNKLGKLVNYADAIICVSNKHKELMIDSLPYLRNKLYVIYNPMPEIPDVDIKRGDFGYFGGDGKLKGFSVLSNSLTLMNTSLSPKIHATKLSMVLTSSEKKLMNNKGFIRYGRLSPENFIDMYSSVQTVIVPSIWPEPLPYVIAEALIRKRLVIASKIGGIPELLKGCEGVIQCEPGNELDLADAIEDIMNIDFASRIKLGNQNRDNFLSTFSDEINIQKFVDLAKSLI
jgi:glycosyltransferase involved in cell wall biosynthesis